MSKVSFDGPNKLINVLVGTSEVDVEADLYSEWKNWVLIGDNAKYLQAFRTFGGDPTSGTQNAPKYFFLLNDWKVYVDDLDLVVQTNLYTEDGSSPYIVVNNGSVSATNSDAQSIRSEIEDIISYNNIIHVCAVTGNDGGNSYPYGTTASPVKTIAGAKAVGATYGLDVVSIHNDIVMDDDLNGWHIYGTNEILDINGHDISKCIIDSFIIMGEQQGTEVIYRNCEVRGISNFAGLFQTCYITQPTPITIQSNARCLLSDSRDGIPNEDAPTFDFANGDVQLSVRAYSGGISVTNSTDANNVGVFEFIAGKFNFGDSNTDGIFKIRGLIDDTNIDLNTGANLTINGLPAELKAIIEKQKIRDAMLLAATIDETADVGSIDDKISRIDSNTQPV